MDHIHDFPVNAYNATKDYIKNFPVNAYDSAKDFLADFPVNAYDSKKDFIKDFSVNAYDSTKDFIKDVSVNAYDPAKDFINDFPVSAVDSKKDFIKDFTVPAIQLTDYTKNFTIPAIQLTDYTKDFTVPSIQLADYTKNFTIPAVAFKNYTKDFTISAGLFSTIGIIWLHTVDANLTILGISNLPSTLPRTNDRLLQYAGLIRMQKATIYDPSTTAEDVRKNIAQRVGAAALKEKSIVWTQNHYPRPTYPLVDITKELGQIQCLVVVSRGGSHTSNTEPHYSVNVMVSVGSNKYGEGGTAWNNSAAWIPPTLWEKTIIKI
jgi:hypothetical protein